MHELLTCCCLFQNAGCYFTFLKSLPSTQVVCPNRRTDFIHKNLSIKRSREQTIQQWKEDCKPGKRELQPTRRRQSFIAAQKRAFCFHFPNRHIFFTQFCSEMFQNFTECDSSRCSTASPGGDSLPYYQHSPSDSVSSMGSPMNTHQVRNTTCTYYFKNVSCSAYCPNSYSRWSYTCYWP